MNGKIAKCGVFTALAIIISSLERLVPLQAIIPLPGIKLGLSNCVILFVLLNFGYLSALSVLIIKCVIVSVLFSGITSLAFSLSGGILALTGMYLLLRFRNLFSLCGISVFGAAMHNVGQILAAVLVLKSIYIFAYLPVLLLISVVTGLLTGLLSEIIYKRIEV